MMFAVLPLLPLLFGYISSIPVYLSATPSSYQKKCAPKPFTKGKHFDRFIVIVFENNHFDNVSVLPNFKNLANNGRLLSNYYATSHPSYPNYLSMIAATTLDMKESDLDSIETHSFNDKTIMNLFDENEISWISVQEKYPPNSCFLGKRYNSTVETEEGYYMRKHNPFVAFSYLNKNIPYCNQHIINDLEFFDRKDVPQFVFYTPDMFNNGHDTNTSFVNEYLAVLIKRFKIQDDLRTVFFVTWDEDDNLGDNRVHGVLMGDGIEVGVDSTYFDHYSISKTLEENWDMGSLGRMDVGSNGFFEFE